MVRSFSSCRTDGDGVCSNLPVAVNDNEGASVVPSDAYRIGAAHVGPRIARCVRVRGVAGQDELATDLSPLVGTEVRQIRLDYQVTLLLVGGPANDERASGFLQIETPFRVETGAGDWTITPSEKRTHAPVSDLLHLKVVTAEMDQDQALRVGFSDGSTLTVERDRRYESWNLTGSGVPEVLVTPQ